MKQSFSLHNTKICIFDLLNFQLWPLIYSLNKDIIQSYRCIHQTDTTLEYIYVFHPIAMLPSFYVHTQIIKDKNQFIAKSISNEYDKEYMNCIQLKTCNESIQVEGTPHDVTITVDISIQMDSLPTILEPTLTTIFKKIYTRLSEFISKI